MGRFLSVKILASRVSGGCFLRLLLEVAWGFRGSEFSFAWYSYGNLLINCPCRNLKLRGGDGSHLMLRFLLYEIL